MENTLSEIFKQRKTKNPNYSVRAFANFLEINSSTLSDILNGKRAIPVNSLDSICEKLNFNSDRKAELLKGIVEFRAKKKPTKATEEEATFIKPDEYHAIVSEWEYAAIFCLFKIKGFNPSAINIAERFNITEKRASDVLNLLVKTGFLEKSGDTYVQKNPNIRTTDDVVSKALQSSHKNSLALANEKLETTPVEQREYTSFTVACNPRKLMQIKKKIRKLCRDVEKTAEDGKESRVYQLAVQFFPLDFDIKE